MSTSATTPTVSISAPNEAQTIQAVHPPGGTQSAFVTNSQLPPNPTAAMRLL